MTRTPFVLLIALPFAACDDTNSDPRVHRLFGNPERAPLHGVPTPDDTGMDGTSNDPVPHLQPCYEDLDGDGWGNTDRVILAVTCPEGTTSSAGDCDDTAVGAHPGLPEVCGDGLDNDCDGSPAHCAWGGDIPADHATATIEGEVGSDHLGVRVTSAGDTDADGLPDLLVTPAEVWDPEGVVLARVYDGALTGTHAEADASATFVSTGSGTFDACGAGDLDADGQDDIVLGLPDADRVVVETGPFSGRVVVENASTVLSEGYAGSRLGASVAQVGHVWGGGSGRSWIVAGAPALSPSGAAVLVAGAGDGLRDEVFPGTTPAAGTEVAGLGDVDGDGYDDFAMTDRAPDAGRVWVFTRGLDTVATATLPALGGAVEGVGDLNRDGYADVAIGDPLRGEVRVFCGPLEGAYDAETADLVLSGTGTDQAGWSIAGRLDVDDDGWTDLLVGAPGADDKGAVYLYYGPLAPHAVAGAVFQGASEDDGFGTSVASLGDTDGDGYDDFAASAPNARVGDLEGAGVVYVYHGRGW